MLVGQIVSLVAAGRVAMEERRRCLKGVASIDLAAIQTIHAFAGSLLRSYPLEAGLPPGFATLDEIEHGVLFEERFRAWFWGEALRPPVGETIRRALLLGLTQKHLRDLAADLEEQHDLLTTTTTWASAPPLDAVAAAHEVGATLTELDTWIQYALNGPVDPLAQVVARAQPWAVRLQTCETEEQALVALRGLGHLRATAGSQRSWGKLPDGTNACRAPLHGDHAGHAAGPAELRRPTCTPGAARWRCPPRCLSGGDGRRGQGGRHRGRHRGRRGRRAGRPDPRSG